MKSSEQLEQESARVRAHVAETIDELRDRATPGQLVDQLLDYAREGNGAQYLRNLRSEIVDHPMPVTLVGAGIAWMIVQSMVPGLRNGADRPAHDGDGRTASDKLRDAGSAVQEAGSAAAETLRDAGGRASDAVGHAMDSATSAMRAIGDRTSSAYQRTASTIRDSSRSVVEGAGTAIEFSKDQPLLLAGLGLTVGAVLGALLPRTRTEDRLMGDAADDVKESASRVAERAKQKTKDAYEDVKSTVRQSDSGARDDSSGPVGARCDVAEDVPVPASPSVIPAGSLSGGVQYGAADTSTTDGNRKS